MNSTRLPNKPLADINGMPMIVRVWQIAVKANLGRVIVACGEPEISEVIRNEGGEAVLTDRIYPLGQIGFSRHSKKWTLQKNMILSSIYRETYPC